MASVSIVTDSVADLPPAVARELGITVVPLVLRFDKESYRDGIDIRNEEFYEKVKNFPSFPVTSAPSPAAFAEAFDAAAEKAEEVLTITLSSKLSGTHNAALQGRELAASGARVQILDSGWAAMAEGFVAMCAARAAQAGARMAEVKEAAGSAMKRVDMIAAFDTLEYLRRGGRIGAAASLLGSLLNVNPLIAVKDGSVHPVGRARSRRKAVEKLCQFAAGFSFIEELAVEDTACGEDADALVEKLGSIFPKERILRSRMTPVIGSHTGPGLLVVDVLGDR